MTVPTPRAALSRRDFLKTAGGCGAAAAVTCLIGDVAPAFAGEASSDNPWSMLIDVTRCTGCQSCALACKQVNERPNPTVEPVKLSSEAYSFVDARPVADSDEPVFLKRQCMHCLHPACASACTVGALHKSAEGPVVYDAKKCIGCRYCQYACPFGVPTYDWQNPLGLIHKCQFCISRLEEGQKPACVASCPTGSLRFGRRNDLLKLARAQITTDPERYVDHVYGEHEVGGTSVLYLSGVPFAQLGLPVLGDEPAPRYAEAVMKKTPIIAASVASLATGLYWLMKRRDLNLAKADVQLPTHEDRHDH